MVSILCIPLFVTAKYTNSKRNFKKRNSKFNIRYRPSALQSSALPTELMNRGSITCSSVGRAFDRRAEGRGFDSRGRTNTQGLKITEK